MLAGLLFATQNTADQPDRLTATLPFGGVTLVEYQARLLIAAGAGQIVVLVARLTPELLGAIARIARRGVAVDAVRHASEAAAKLHPLARVLVLADGLITTPRTVEALAGGSGEALLVLPLADAAPGDERLGGAMAWAGVARIEARRLAEVARLPADYDPQSTLLRLAEQGRATHVLLPPDARRQGHGIEHHADAFARRGRAALAAIVSDRRGWFERAITAPLARAVLPGLVQRRWPGAAVSVAAAVLGIGALAGIVAGGTRIGLLLTLLATLGLGLGATLSGIRDETMAERAAVWGRLVVPALAALALGASTGRSTADPSALALAAALVTLGMLAERAGPERARLPWWGSPPAYLLAVTVATAVGWPRAGLTLAAGYAAGTCASGIEALRRREPAGPA